MEDKGKHLRVCVGGERQKWMYWSVENASGEEEDEDRLRSCPWEEIPPHPWGLMSGR